MYTCSITIVHGAEKYSQNTGWVGSIENVYGHSVNSTITLAFPQSTIINFIFTLLNNKCIRTSWICKSFLRNSDSRTNFSMKQSFEPRCLLHESKFFCTVWNQGFGSLCNKILNRAFVRILVFGKFLIRNFTQKYGAPCDKLETKSEFYLAIALWKYNLSIYINHICVDKSLSQTLRWLCQPLVISLELNFISNLITTIKSFCFYYSCRDYSW